MKKRVHIFVSGRVQGVFFRAHTKEKALELDIKGWVRNLPDGRVEGVFEGEEERLNELIRWLKEGGPPLASIENLEILNEDYKGEFSDFEIKY